MRKACIIICSSCREKLIALDCHVYKNYLSICCKTIFKGICLVDSENEDMEDYGIVELEELGFVRTTEADDESQIIVAPIGIYYDEEISTKSRPVYKVCAEHDGFYE